MTSPVVTKETNPNYFPTWMVDTDGSIKAEYEDLASQISQGVSSIVGDLPPAEKAIFMALLLVLLEATLPQQVTSWSADTLTANLALIEDAAVAIAALFDTAGGMKDIMAILVELTMLLEVDSVDSRTRARENGLQMTKFQAKKLRREGDKEFNSAKMTLVLQVLIATFSTLLAVQSMRNSMSQISQAKSANENYKMSFQEEQMSKSDKLGDQEQNPMMKEAHANNAKTHNLIGRESETEALKFERFANSFNMGADLLRSISQAASTMLQAKYNRDIKGDQAQQAEYASLANYYNSESDVERDFASDLKRFLEKLAEYMDAIAQLESQQMSQVSNNIPG